MLKALNLLFSPDRLVRISLLELLQSVLKQNKSVLLASEEINTDQGNSVLRKVLNVILMLCNEAAVIALQNAFSLLYCPPRQSEANDRHSKLQYDKSSNLANIMLLKC